MGLHRAIMGAPVASLAFRITVCLLILSVVLCIKPSEVEEAMAKAQAQVAAAGTGLPPASDAAALSTNDRKAKEAEANKAEEEMDDAVEKFETGLMTDGVMGAATDQAERLAKMD